MKQNQRHRKAQNKSFKIKLLVSIFRIAVPVIAIICIGSFLLLSASFKQTAEKAQDTALEKVQNDLYHIIDNAENLSRDMIFNNEIQLLLADSAAGEKYPENSAAAYYINGFIANRDFINCVVLTGNDQTLYSTEKAFTNLSDYTVIQQSWWFEQLNTNSQPFEWFIDPGADTASRTSLQDTPRLMLARPIYSIEDYTTKLGYLMIYLDDDYLKEILDGVPFGSTTNLWITDEQGTIILKNSETSDYSFLLDEIPGSKENGFIRSQGQNFVIGSKQITGKDWNICIATPYREVNTSMTLFIVQLLMMICTIALLLIFMAVHTASSISKPIILLSKIMDAYHGKDTQVPAQLDHLYQERTDEIGQIYHSYRQMILRMDTLIQEIYIKNLEKKDAELALLQSQINPHFLYNTLDSINWMALANDQDEISEMVTALSDTFRLSLTKSNSSYVQLSQEIEYVKSYLVLQKFRYTDRLTYALHAEDDALSFYIPKFILQPIVENALKHGIDSIEEGGKIDIVITSGYKRTSDHTDSDTHSLLIQVINDGTAISLDQMKELLDFDPERMEFLAFNKKGYGVQNIHRRIRILCGNDFGLQYYTKNSRTYCEVRLPIKTEDRLQDLPPASSAFRSDPGKTDVPRTSCSFRM